MRYLLDEPFHGYKNKTISWPAVGKMGDDDYEEEHKDVSLAWLMGHLVGRWRPELMGDAKELTIDIKGMTALQNIVRAVDDGPKIDGFFVFDNADFEVAKRLFPALVLRTSLPQDVSFSWHAPQVAAALNNALEHLPEKPKTKVEQEAEAIAAGDA